MDNDSPISASARAKIRIRIKGVDYRMADQTAADIIASIAGTGARISGPFPLPSQVEEPRTALREEIRSLATHLLEKGIRMVSAVLTRHGGTLPETGLDELEDAMVDCTVGPEDETEVLLEIYAALISAALSAE